MPVRGGHRGLVAAAVVAAILIVAAVAPALAQAGPFGVGTPEAGAGAPGGGIFGWIAARQNEFYRGLTAGLKAMRSDPNAGLWLVLVSFAYGVFHAAGPGHGKAVITSYVLANRETLKRGIVLSLISALVQGLTAIVFVGVSVTVFRVTALQMTDATTALERTSAAAILALGLWLTWTKIVAPAITARRAARAPAPIATESDVVDLTIDASGMTPNRAAELCACGQTHAPDPTTLGGPFDLRKAVAAVAAVGIRPCTGALIVLVFAFAQGLPWVGVLSVLAMSVGTGITVSALASLAVSARALALRFAGDDGVWSLRVLRGAEVFGALIVLVTGVLFAGAVIWGGPLPPG
ncbi:MAG: nickel/cobalt transporter [Siculibacillus sp.]|nr:nickel/cobalt transporter [Siculibacillus sp.]